MKRLLRSALCVVTVAALSGCGGSSSDPAGPGLVGTLTGDDDREVSAQLQEQVGRALAQPADGTPIPD